jgi:hypothetical protein
MRIRLEYLFETGERDMTVAEIEKIRHDLDSAAKQNENLEVKWVGRGVFRED